MAIFAQFKPVKGLSFQIGFDKMPFSSENLLSPYKYYFSDKSFLTQKITAWSDVGGLVAYKWDEVIPFEIKAGVFISRGFSRQMQFQKELNYVALGLAYDIANLHLEAEYIYKWYKEKEGVNFAPTHALYGFAFYKFHVDKKWLQHIDVGARYDAITSNCDEIGRAHV